VALCAAARRYRFPREWAHMMVATPVTRRTRQRMVATSRHAACVTQPGLMAVLRPTLPHTARGSITLSTARASGSSARVVTTTPRVCRSDGKLVPRALSNTFRPAIIPARRVTMGADHSAEIWISKDAAGVTKGPVSEPDDLPHSRQRKGENNQPRKCTQGSKQTAIKEAFPRVLSAPFCGCQFFLCVLCG